MSLSPHSASDEPAMPSNGDQDKSSPVARSAAGSSPAPRSISQREASAFLSWVKAVLPARAEQLKQPEDLADGVALFEILAVVDAAHFLNPHAQTGEANGENYALKLGTLKRLYKLMMQYYTETLLLSPPPACADPDLNEIARSSSVTELSKFCKLAIGITIQSEATKAEHVLAIQTLAQEDQQSLMVVIEEVMSGQSSIASPPASAVAPSSGGETEGPELQRLRAQHTDLEKLYLALMEDHQTLKAGQEDTQNEKEVEDQNSELIDRNAALEKESAKVIEYKPLIEKYKEQIADLTRRNGSLTEETGTLKYNLEQSALQLKSLEEARTRDAEEIELYREKVEEMELGSSKDAAAGKSGGEVPLDAELEDTLRGTTTTDLKLRIHQLSRELKSAKTQEAESSDALVLENLLEDSQRMKQRYEADYWKEYRLRLQRDGELDKIRTGGEGSLADGPEAARALRLRLAEVITDLDSLRAEHAELSVKYESNEQELASARADLVLVDKDKLDILASLRSTVSQEGADLEEKVKTLEQELRSAQELEKSMSSQIQGLLMDKISLMESGAAGRSEGPTIERTSLSPDDREGLTTKNKELESRLQDLEDKMRKARAFIRQQDKLLQDARKGTASQNGGDANGAGVKADEELRRENSTLKQEQALMLSAFHHLSSSRTSKNLNILASLHPHSGATASAQNGNGGAIEGVGGQGRGRERGGGGGVVPRLGGLAVEASAPPPKSWLGQQKRRSTGIGWVLGRR
ncbi:hypothetical protein BCV69DRAFT_140680 [Microstroma glucosiphilum]|uniref:HOOK N-terminal domain-containing protein n=1 Tax=Pseudomicrostroma glucosiphilum TaxID=1684307 RepID=A0A316UD76_9BASI|nr:hypothetical protein BCV69DRAFT_140680 [Pseudomicrostroma glucosiphilum]PWN22323.1 hypothetical protein BCV69DRAFT_140680 [Pseudomicrostroma glucosiphilum]